VTDHCFISYSTADALDFARKLTDELEGGEDKFIDAWFDKRDIDPARDWDDQLVEGIKACKCMAFVMSNDSTAPGSMCKNEWTWALKYKKPVIPIRFHKDVEQPFGLGNRQWIDFSDNFEHGLAKLRKFLREMDSPASVLQAYKDRLADAERALRRAKGDEAQRIQVEIEGLKKQIETQQKIVDDPDGAKAQTQKNIETGLERERKPEKPTAAETTTKFINPPPGIAPTYFQDREVENKEAVKFLNDDSQTMLTIVGRGGVGKTAMVCRLLKGLESGELPDGLGAMKVEGIVYLSESGSHRVNFANIFYDLCKLLPTETANELDAVYKNPQGSTESKMRAVLEKFTGGRVALLLDNFEPLVDTEAFTIRDAELDEALRAFLNGTHTAVNIVITTRVAPKPLNLTQPGRQRVLTLDEGLESPYAENILREMDSDGRMGLKSAPADLLRRARERTRGYPRALEALFAILASDRYTTLEELLAMPTPENVVEALVGEAFNRLDVNAQKVMQALAVYNRPVTPAAVDYLLAPHLPAIDSAPILQRLINMHFARRFEGGKFYLHPVDKDFALGLIPDGNAKDNIRSGSGLEFFKYFMETVNKYPDLLQNQETLKQAAQEAPPDFLKDVLTSIFSLDLSIREKMQDAKNFQDKEYLAILDQSIKVPQVWTWYALTFRAADYFRQARKPRAEWKKLEDLSAQLAEFDLRCAAGDYDSAASVLTDFDFDYLLLWGHYRIALSSYHRVQKRINDKTLQSGITGNMGTTLYYMGQYTDALIYHNEALETARSNKDKINEAIWVNWIANSLSGLGRIQDAITQYELSLLLSKEANRQDNEGTALSNLGSCYANLGNMHKAIEFYEQALVIDRKIGDRRGESADLGNLGSRYLDLGEAYKAIEYYKQTLIIKHEIGDSRGESIHTENTGHALLNLEEYQNAIENYRKAIQIADEISLPMVQLNARNGMAEAYLFQNDLVNACGTIEAALQYDVPQYNHDDSALHGIITLRQGDASAARQAFTRAIAQADEILAKTPDYYSALDAKGLSICGLLICDLRLKSDVRGAVSAPNDDAPKTGQGDPAPTVDEAIKTFRAARKIAPHAGVVKSVLRLFDELAKCDTEGLLEGVREAVEGKAENND